MEPTAVRPRQTAMARPPFAVQVVVGVLALGLLTACDDAEQDAAPAGSPTPTTAAEASVAPNLTCGRGIMQWPAEAMEGGIESETPIEEIRAALADLVKRAGIDAPQALQDVEIDEAPWFVLAEESEQIAVATGPWSASGPGRTGQVVYLEQEGDGWRSSGWGDCWGLAPVLEPQRQWVRVYSVTRTDPLSTRLIATVGEVECTGARDPRPYLLEPTIVETADTVLVSWTSKAVVGGATCPGNPSVSQTLELAAPLGDRVLRDGSTWPYRKVPVRE